MTSVCRRGVILLLVVAGLVGPTAAARGQGFGPPPPQPKFAPPPPVKPVQPSEPDAVEVNKQLTWTAELLGNAVGVFALVTFSAAGLLGLAMLVRLLVKSQTPSDPLVAASNDAWVQARLKELEASGKLAEPPATEPDKAD